MSELTIDQEAEQLVRAATDQLMQPHPGECLACFVARMLDTIGCDTSLRFACHYRDRVAPRSTALERRLGDLGGFCDCEIFLSGLRLADHVQAVDDEGRTCRAGLRAGVRRRTPWLDSSVFPLGPAPPWGVVSARRRRPPPTGGSRATSST